MIWSQIAVNATERVYESGAYRVVVDLATRTWTLSLISSATGLGVFSTLNAAHVVAVAHAAQVKAAA